MRIPAIGVGANMLNKKTKAPLILVVEDSVLVAMAIEDALQQRGFSVMVASTLAGARELIEKRVPTAALLDLQLPDGVALDLARELHVMGCAVAISSGFESSSMPEGYEFAAQFHKPVSSDVLAEWAGLIAVS